MSSWDLFLENRVEVALSVALSNPGSELNNAIVYMMFLGRFGDAIDLATRLIETSSRSDLPYISRSTALWLMDDKPSAVNSLIGGLNASYSDAAGGIEINSLLYLFSKEIRDESAQEIAELKLSRLVRRNSWPELIAIGKFVLGKISVENLLEETVRNETLFARNQAKKKFYVWFQKMVNGQPFYDDLIDSFPSNRKAFLEEETIISYWMSKRMTHFNA
jgi:lipoprotein NlpI